MAIRAETSDLSIIDSVDLLRELTKRGIDFFAGVPDSLLRRFCACLDAELPDADRITSANEGNAVALVAGHYLATGRIGAVYMQNSGLGNALNPLISLAHNDVYRIPMLVIVGWRGEPGVKDEPQHVCQGRITPALLELLDIPYWILGREDRLEVTLDNAFAALQKRNTPVALLVCKGVFSGYPAPDDAENEQRWLREAALRTILGYAGERDVFLATTGKTSRELFELRIARGEQPRDFLTVGSMGHVASIALGVALEQPERRVWCLDGDGSLIMHLGSMPTIGALKPSNLIHVLLNNAAHESVGGQPTAAKTTDFCAIAMACGYRAAYRAADESQLRECLDRVRGEKGPVFLEMMIDVGSRKNLGRPTMTPEDTKQAFMKCLMS